MRVRQRWLRGAHHVECKAGQPQDEQVREDQHHAGLAHPSPVYVDTPERGEVVGWRWLRDGVRARAWILDVPACCSNFF